MIGNRIREARENAGLSQRALAAKLDGLDASAICRIERGERKVASDELYDIAEALRVTTGALLGVSARSGALVVAARLGAETRPEYLDHALERVAQILEMDDLLNRVSGPGPTPGRQLRLTPTARTAVAQGKELAAGARKALGLGTAPVGDLPALLEERLGAHVVAQPIEGDVHGICVNDGGVAVILVNSNDKWARQRYTLAHELCHLLCGDVDLYEVTSASTSPGSSRETRAEVFAADFLAPAEALHEVVGGRAIDAGVVGQLMDFFGMSFDAMCWRLLNLRYISKARMEQLREGGARTAVAAAALTSAFDERARAVERVVRPPTRLVRRAVEAYARGEIGVGVVATILGDSDVGVTRRRLEEQGIVPEPLPSGAELV